ncbi:MAG: flippase-like domain-containing protein [Ignavibacteriales bacterium]|nr:flippase-like domain-containing protein [Ignavibacteriales bacterium]
MLQKIKNKIYISLGLTGLIYLAFTIYADYELVYESFSRFPVFIIPLVLLLVFSNYFTRFLKWDYYLGLLNIQIKKRDSFTIFMSGLIMSVTPGKMGEVLKSYLLKQISGAPVSKTAPIVVVERITDFVSLVFIALIGAYIFDYGRMIVLFTGLFFLIVILAISNRNLSLKLIEAVSGLRIARKYAGNLKSAYESSYTLLRGKPLLLMSLLSLLSWFLECLGYYIILVNFKVEVSIIWSSFVYCFSTIIGAITMLPGGLGVTDGSLTYLVSKQGIPLSTAVASTFIIRAATLWFAVLVGVIAIAMFQRKMLLTSKESELP